MKFASRDKRDFWITSTLNLIPDLVIAFIISKSLSAGFLGFILIFFSIQLLYLLIWIKQSIWNWLIFFISWRKKLKNSILDSLNENNFPNPGTHENSIDSYLNSVVENKEVPIETRLKAATQLGALNSFIGQGNIQNYIRISMACEDAVEQYKNQLTQNDLDK